MENQLNTDSRDEPVSVGEWMLTILVSFIPLINIVMYFIWAFGKNTKHSKSNWARAILLWLTIVMAFYFFVFLAIISA
ncbi:MAG: hypothetical protein WD266_12555 [Balneolales bacterium]